jgi:sugar phosphate isomerase/epimerase
LTEVFSQYLINVSWESRRHEPVAFAGRHGYGVEIEDFRAPEVIDDPRACARLAAWYREQLRQVSGLISVHGPYEGVCPGSGSAAVAATTHTRIAACLDAAEALGASRVVFHVAAEEVTPEDRAAWLKRQAARWQMALGGRSLKVMLENEWATPPGLLRDAVDSVGLGNVGACLDVGHAHLCARLPVADWVPMLGSRIRHLHLHDNESCPDDDQHLLPGRGTIDWDRLAAALRAQGLCPPAVIELGSIDPQTIDMGFVESLNR